MKRSEIIESRYSMNLYSKRNITIVRGRKSLLWDDEGRQYIDCTSGHGVASIGYANKDVINALAVQSRRLITCPGIFYNDTRSDFLELLLSIVPQNLKKVYLCNSGAESIEAAIKFARLTTGKKEFICAVRGFHGRTLGALSATFNPKYKEDFEPLIPGFSFVPFNNKDALASCINENTAAIILELIQGEGGVHIAHAEYINGIKKLCIENNIILIIDEIQTGFCRTGKMLALEHYYLKPDILCLSKAIAGGLPFAAVICTGKIKDGVGKHSSTFGGNPLSCAAASASIKYMIKKDLAVQAKRKGQYLMNKLKKIESTIINEIRGLGLMIAIELNIPALPIINDLEKEGVLVLSGGKKVIRLLPPLIITYKQLGQVYNILKRILEDHNRN
jgi:acetylornithine/LysW-gamma-L-lysine aminotransferase